MRFSYIIAIALTLLAHCGEAESAEPTDYWHWRVELYEIGLIAAYTSRRQLTPRTGRQLAPSVK